MELYDVYLSIFELIGVFIAIYGVYRLLKANKELNKKKTNVK